MHLGQNQEYKEFQIMGANESLAWVIIFLAWVIILRLLILYLSFSFLYSK